MTNAKFCLENFWSCTIFSPLFRSQEHLSTRRLQRRHPKLWKVQEFTRGSELCTHYYTVKIAASVSEQALRREALIFFWVTVFGPPPPKKVRALFSSPPLLSAWMHLQQLSTERRFLFTRSLFLFKFSFPVFRFLKKSWFFGGRGSGRGEDALQRFMLAHLSFKKSLISFFFNPVFEKASTYALSLFLLCIFWHYSSSSFSEKINLEWCSGERFRKQTRLRNPLSLWGDFRITTELQKSFK